MGLDMYLSAKKTISYKKERDLYYDTHRIFGSFSTEPRADVSFYVSNWRHQGPDEKAESQQFHAIAGLFGIGEFIPESSPSGYVTFKHGADYTEDSVTVDMHVGYWRKANQIHQWFVDNVQGGEDECNPFECSREQLQTLVGTCKQVLNRTEVEAGEIHVGTQYTSTGGIEQLYEDGNVIVNPAVAQELLPTQGGFFFGGTDHDAYYIQDLDDTITQVEKALTLPDDWTLVYRSSW